MELDSHKLLVGSGNYPDTVNFNEYIQKNMKLYELNNDLPLSTHAAANFTRGEVKYLSFKSSFDLL
jgi:20S proteasome subunit beta 4